MIEFRSPSRTTGEVVVAAKGLTKHYPAVGRVGTVHALDDLAIELRAGRVLGMVGESGSGKSTAARVLSLLVMPTKGTIELDGEPVDIRRRGAVRKYRSTVQMVFQDPFSSLNPARRVDQILDRPLLLHHHATRRDVTDRLRDLLTQVGLTPPDEFLEKYPHELSGGQRQRVGIARALATGSRVLLADEPVSMLDVSIRAGILNLLAGLRDSRGLALLYITHDLASAHYLSDDIMVMYAGEAIEYGPSDVIVEDAKHPYTKLLLASVPEPGTPRPLDRARSAAGDLPDMSRPPAGCRFHPRCPYTMDICRTEAPVVTPLDEGHWVRCHLVDAVH